MSDDHGTPPNPPPHMYFVNGFEDWYIEINDAGEEVIHLVESDSEGEENGPVGQDNIQPVDYQIVGELEHLNADVGLGNVAAQEDMLPSPASGVPLPNAVENDDKSFVVDSDSSIEDESENEKENADVTIKSYGCAAGGRKKDGMKTQACGYRHVPRWSWRRSLRSWGFHLERKTQRGKKNGQIGRGRSLKNRGRRSKPFLGKH